MSATTTTQPPTTKREKTPEEVIGGMKRMVKAVATRAENEDPWMAADMLDIAAQLEEAAVGVIATLRAKGYTWNDIALSLGIEGKNRGTTACKRYARRVDAILARRAQAGE